MTTPLELAKQGDPKAIAELLNRILQPHGFKAQVVKQNQCLKVLVQGSQQPNQERFVNFVVSGIKKLELADIKGIEVLGHQVGVSRPSWKQQIVLRESQAPSVKSMPVHPGKVGTKPNIPGDQPETPEQPAESQTQVEQKKLEKRHLTLSEIVLVVGGLFFAAWIFGGALTGGSGSSQSKDCFYRGVGLVGTAKGERPSSSELSQIQRKCASNPNSF